MAAPPEVTLKDLSGQWIMNKTLSDDPDPLLQLQGIGWFLRKAISLATITLTVTEYPDPKPPHTTHIDISQVATGGIGGTTEKRTLDWEERPHKDGIFGEVKGKSRWVDLETFKSEGGKAEEFLKIGWLQEGEGKGKGRAVQSWVESVGGGWTAEQLWGFEEVDGKRYHARHVVVRKGDDWKQARLVYDYQKKVSMVL